MLPAMPTVFQYYFIGERRRRSPKFVQFLPSELGTKKKK
jgi:hypothetical protein